jgi:predicted polyphosphate/ATP-dependent NAD kinase
MTSRIGFLINPIAGMGGRVGLKGTDNVVRAAIELGAQPSSHLKADETLRELKVLLDRLSGDVGIIWLTCSGRMGAEALRAAGFADFEVVYELPGETSDADTKAAARRLLELSVDLILFCGGDGTARDIVSVVAQRVPILGIPSGVKMYSGVFGISTARRTGGRTRSG